MTGNTMRGLAWAAVAAGAMIVAGAGAWAAALPAGSPARPVVVELFQSQGCSSCPPADANLNALADRKDVLPLNFSVTYWDQLGWKDTFARKEFTARQWDYAHGLGNSNVGTPQMVVEGRRELIGQDRREVDAAIAQARPATAAMVSLVGGDVTIAAGAAPMGGADVWLVRYDPRTQLVPIRRGENGGKTLPQRNVVRELTRLGAWKGSAARYPLAASKTPGLKTAVLVQTKGGGPILGAGRD
jgi:hypothetical protein